MSPAARMVQTPLAPDAQQFYANATPDGAPRLRTLANSWSAGGGDLQVGKSTIRLMAGQRARPFTAITLYAEQGGTPLVEMCRPLLRAHGLSDDAWDAWCDERPELENLGFDRRASYPWIRLKDIRDPDLLRLAEGMRDIARLVGAK